MANEERVREEQADVIRLLSDRLHHQGIHLGDYWREGQETGPPTVFHTEDSGEGEGSPTEQSARSRARRQLARSRLAWTTNERRARAYLQGKALVHGNATEENRESGRLAALEENAKRKAVRLLGRSFKRGISTALGELEQQQQETVPDSH